MVAQSVSEFSAQTRPKIANFKLNRAVLVLSAKVIIIITSLLRYYNLTNDVEN